MVVEIAHVLIVDDSRVDRLVASRVLNILNIRVTVAEGAMQALDILEADAGVNLILTDYSMPNMTGYDLLRAVKASPRLKHIPVVVTCTEAIPERIMECLHGGAEEYVIKPIKVEDVPRFLSYM